MREPSQFPNNPWQKMTGMRNRLVHAYFEINLDILWKTGIEGLPPIIEELQMVLSRETKPD